jgi:hypothetical protein
MTKDNVLIKYIRDEKRNPIAAIVGLSNNAVGWSVVNPKEHFNKRLGVQIAKTRALSGKDLIPHSTLDTEKLLEEMAAMKDRTIRYFKR